MNFWADAKQTQVTWAPGDPRLEALIAGSRFPNLYALVADGCVLKVGEAGTVRNGKRATVGKRLSKHVKDGCAPEGSSYPGEFPAWWEFSGALVGFRPSSRATTDAEKTHRSHTEAEVLAWPREPQLQTA